ncbi:MAG TPA: pilus assembly protein N-terminal domain-containing protein [Acidobacteriaceae bacterium]|nr:pilus assembly protein N-terminal domain-containing protein [Acidobacteriaceae bacterium]
MLTIRSFSPALLVAALSAACSGAGAQNHALAVAAPAPFVGDMSTSAQVVGEPLHLLVGRSMFVNTDNRIRRIYVSNPDVLDSFTSSPRQIVITAKTPGVASVVLWDEGGASHSYLVNSDLDVTGLNKAIKDAFPSENIRAEGHGAEVTLAGSVNSTATSDAAFKLASLYSKDVANSLVVATPHIPQVKLKVRVVEIDRSRAMQLGFNFFGNNGSHTFNTTTSQFGSVTAANSTTTTSTAGSTTQSAGASVSSLLELSNLLNLFYYNKSLGIGAAMQALANKQILQILAEPTITTVSGEKASFLAGGSFPYPLIEPGLGGVNTVTVVFRDYGVKVDFTPTVNADGTINMKIVPEVSALDYSNAVVLGGYTLPAISTRRADTRVELHSGQSFVISGLLDNRTIDQLEKVPGIGDIPILGKLFQSRSTNHSVTELAIIVTPTVIDPLAQDPAATVTQPKMVVPFINNPKFDKEIVPKTPPPQPQPNPRPEDVPVHD